MEKQNYLNAIKNLKESKKPTTPDEFNYKCDCLYDVHKTKNEYAQWYHGNEYGRLNELYQQTKYFYQIDDSKDKTEQRKCYEIAENNLFGFLKVDSNMLPDSMDLNRPTKIRKLK